MQQKVESQRVKLKDLKSLAIATVAALAMPVAVWSTREGPLQANSAPELAKMAVERTRFEVANEVLWHVDPFETKQEQMNQRWREFREELNNSDLPAEAIEPVTGTARAHLKDKQWPVLVTHGWIKNEPVWVLASAWRLPATGGHSGTWTIANMHKDRHQGVESLTRILIFESKVPYRLLNG